MPKTLAVIPARLSSSRFPNKPLKTIHGIPMVIHCLYRARMSKKIDRLILATPDQEIFDTCQNLGFESMITSNSHERASDRAAEVLEKLKSNGENFENIVLLQGDEPQLDPKLVDKLIDSIENSNMLSVNIIQPIGEKDMDDASVVKTILSKSGEIKYFSRSKIPFGSKKSFRQLGMIAFKCEGLELYSSLNPTKHEILESIDMMRFIDNDIKMGSLISEDTIIGVDEPHHIKITENLMKDDEYLKLYKAKYLKSISNNDQYQTRA